MSNQPQIIIIAGPNGAGKTTFAREFLPQEANCPTFINADLIAAGLAPFEPEKAAVRAGRLMLQEISKNYLARESFAIETTLAGKGYAQHIPIWQSAGYRVTLLYLRLTCVEEAISRVKQRVQMGGHNIPEAVIRRRYEISLANLYNLYIPLVDQYAIYDNSGYSPMLLERNGQ